MADAHSRATGRDSLTLLTNVLLMGPCRHAHAALGQFRVVCRFTLRAASGCTHHGPVGSRLKMTSVPLGPVVCPSSANNMNRSRLILGKIRDRVYFSPCSTTLPARCQPVRPLIPSCSSCPDRRDRDHPTSHLYPPHSSIYRATRIIYTNS